MVHGRHVIADERNGYKKPKHSQLEFVRENGGFHAGTEKAAHERMSDLGESWGGTMPRFYHGRVDPAKMRNTPAQGNWEVAGPDKVRPDRGRIADQQEGWAQEHENSYYRNDYEDEGSTSAILATKGTGRRDLIGDQFQTPDNFETWRGAVGNALRRGDEVPRNVHASFRASGGAAAPQYNFDTRYDGALRNSFKGQEDMLPTARWWGTEYVGKNASEAPF